MSGTPRTDSQSVKGYETYNTSEYTHKSCAMQLEYELNLARLLLDRVYRVYTSGNTGNDFIAALDPVMHDVAQFCRSTSNPTGLRCAGLDAHKQDPVVGQPELTK